MWSSLSAGTGLCAAAGALIILEDGKPSAGVYCPEDWIRPERYYQALVAIGIPESEILDKSLEPVG